MVTYPTSGESDRVKRELQLKPWSRTGVVSLLNLSHLKFIQISRKIDICQRWLHGLTCSFSKLKTSQPKNRSNVQVIALNTEGINYGITLRDDA